MGKVQNVIKIQKSSNLSSRHHFAKFFFYDVAFVSNFFKIIITLLFTEVTVQNEIKAIL